MIFFWIQRKRGTNRTCDLTRPRSRTTSTRTWRPWTFDCKTRARFRPATIQLRRSRALLQIDKTRVRRDSQNTQENRDSQEILTGTRAEAADEAKVCQAMARSIRGKSRANQHCSIKHTKLWRAMVSRIFCIRGVSIIFNYESTLNK